MPQTRCLQQHLFLTALDVEKRPNRQIQCVVRSCSLIHRQLSSGCILTLLRTFWLRTGTRELSELYAVEKQYGIQQQRFWRCLNILKAHIWFGALCIILPIHAKAVVCTTWLIMAQENGLSRVCHYFDISLLPAFKPHQPPFFCPTSGWAD